MKKNYLGLLLIFILAVACNKGTVDLSTKENTLVGYTVEGIYDLTLNSNSPKGKEKLRLSISNNNGIQENVTLGLEGVPENVSTTISPAEGVAPFQTEVVFTLTGTPKPGKYPVKFIVTDKNGRSKVSIISLTIPIVDLSIDVMQPGDFYIYNNGPTNNVNSVYAYSAGIHEPIQLSFSNLPKGVEAVFSANNEFSLNSNISFNATNVINGVYPIILNAKTSSGITESYATNLIVTENCSPSLTSEKYSKMLRYEDGILVDSVWMDVRLAPHPYLVNLIQFYGYNYGPNSYNALNFRLNCNDQTLIMEKQYVTLASINYSNVEGKGSFNIATKEIIIDCNLENGKKNRIIIAK